MVSTQGVRSGRCAVGDDECGVVAAKEVVHGSGEPARVPELEGVPARSQRLERGFEDAVVALEVRRQLPEDRAELAGASKGLEALVHALRAVGDVAQPLHMREVAARLDGEQEAVGRTCGPALDGLRARQPVERRVDLDRVERLRVELEPA